MTSWLWTKLPQQGQSQQYEGSYPYIKIEQYDL